jgi:transposase
MDESKIIETYNNGVSEIVSLMKDMNIGLTNHINILNKEIISLRLENQKLNARIAELESKKNKNSKNSSKPPSTDNHKKTSNSRQKTGRSTGGQKGHEGKTLLKVENPDNIVDIKAEACECRCCLSNIEGKIQTRQIFELPKITINVTEFRTHEVVCPKCNKVHKTEFPETITQPIQYGKNLQALMVYLSNYQLIPLALMRNVMLITLEI